MEFYWYPNCSTCKKAKKWLDENGIEYNEIHIVENPPSKEKLRTMVEKSELPISKFFNTSGKKYRELNMKEKVKQGNPEELLELLSADGMLIKRPLAFNGEKTTVGFKEAEFEKNWK